MLCFVVYYSKKKKRKKERKKKKNYLPVTREKKNWMEVRGFEPLTSRMQSERSTTELNPQNLNTKMDHEIWLIKLITCCALIFLDTVNKWHFNGACCRGLFLLRWPLPRAPSRAPCKSVESTMRSRSLAADLGSCPWVLRTVLRNNTRTSNRLRGFRLVQRSHTI